jgi:hypothetical protein
MIVVEVDFFTVNIVSQYLQYAFFNSRSCSVRDCVRSDPVHFYWYGSSGKGEGNGKD